MPECLSNYIDDNGVYQGPEICYGDIVFPHNHKVKSLGVLREVRGSLRLDRCPELVSLGNLRRVRGTFSLRFCPVLKSLGKLRIIDGYALLGHSSSLTSFGSLEIINSSLSVYSLPFFSCTKLRRVRGIIHIALSGKEARFVLPLGIVFEELAIATTILKEVKVPYLEYKNILNIIVRAPITDLPLLRATLPFYYSHLISARMKGVLCASSS